MSDRLRVVSGQENLLEAGEEAVSDRSRVVSGRENLLEAGEEAVSGRSGVVSGQENLLEAGEEAVSDRSRVVSGRENLLEAGEEAVSGHSRVVSGQENLLEAGEGALGGLCSSGRPDLSLTNTAVGVHNLGLKGSHAGSLFAPGWIDYNRLRRVVDSACIGVPPNVTAKVDVPAEPD